MSGRGIGRIHGRFLYQSNDTLAACSSGWDLRRRQARLPGQSTCGILACVHTCADEEELRRLAAAVARLYNLAVDGLYSFMPHGTKIMSLRIMQQLLAEFQELWRPEVLDSLPSNGSRAQSQALDIACFDPFGAARMQAATMQLIRASCAARGGKVRHDARACRMQPAVQHASISLSSARQYKSALPFLYQHADASIDSWDDVRWAAMTCLRLLPSRLPGYEGEQQAAELLEYAFELALSDTAAEAESGESCSCMRWWSSQR